MRRENRPADQSRPSIACNVGPLEAENDCSMLPTVWYLVLQRQLQALRTGSGGYAAWGALPSLMTPITLYGLVAYSGKCSIDTHTQNTCVFQGDLERVPKASGASCDLVWHVQKVLTKALPCGRLRVLIGSLSGSNDDGIKASDQRHSILEPVREKLLVLLTSLTPLFVSLGFSAADVSNRSKF